MKDRQGEHGEHEQQRKKKNNFIQQHLEQGDMRVQHTIDYESSRLTRVGSRARTRATPTSTFPP